MTETKNAAVPTAPAGPPASPSTPSPPGDGEPDGVPPHVIIGGIAVLLALGYLVFDAVSGGKATAFVMGFLGFRQPAQPDGDEPQDGG